MKLPAMRGEQRVQTNTSHYALPRREVSRELSTGSAGNITSLSRLVVERDSNRPAVSGRADLRLRPRCRVYSAPPSGHRLSDSLFDSLTVTRPGAADKTASRFLTWVTRPGVGDTP